jgi:protein-S-isoprenylcysteine O-methyltransferase Ste14
MKPAAAIAGTSLFLIAPATVAGFVPWYISRWHSAWTSRRAIPLQIAGALLILAAAAVLVESFAHFAIKGLGTPSPALPTRYLVVSGFYRYVRNPMYVAVASIILGQALFFGSLALLAYATLVCGAFQLFVMTYEEPKLRTQFGSA